MKVERVRVRNASVGKDKVRKIIWKSSEDAGNCGSLKLSYFPVGVSQIKIINGMFINQKESSMLLQDS